MLSNLWLYCEITREENSSCHDLDSTSAQDGCTRWRHTQQPPSLLISLTDLDLDQHPTLWMPHHLYSGLNYWGRPTKQPSRRIPGPASLLASSISSHPDRCHLRTLVLVWQWLEWLVKDSINVSHLGLFPSTLPSDHSNVWDFSDQR